MPKDYLIQPERNYTVEATEGYKNFRIVWGNNNGVLDYSRISKFYSFLSCCAFNTCPSQIVRGSEFMWCINFGNCSFTFFCRVHCAESGEESTETESVYSLKCHISQEVNHLHEGLRHVSLILTFQNTVTCHLYFYCTYF